ncbi:molybdopterin-guanine dinucleotide biosynthesis protein B [Virgibacillus oceani]
MESEQTFSICQIVGYKNTGKTTLMEKIINYFTAQNHKIGTLKHHGHGGEPKHVHGTDSFKHLQAGSSISAVQGEKQLQLSIADVSAYPLEKLISLYTFMPIDILLLEGFKQADYPKIIIIRNKEDKALLELSNIIAVVSWDKDIPLPADKKTFLMEKVDEKLPEIASLIAGD